MYRKMEEEIENLTKQVAEQADQRTRARAHDASGSGARHCTGDRRLPGRPGVVRGWQSAGQLRRDHPEGVLQWRKPAARWNYKQGSPLLRFLWCEAGAHAVRKDPELQRFYRRKLVQKGLGRARVAVARKLGIPHKSPRTVEKQSRSGQG